MKNDAVVRGIRTRREAYAGPELAVIDPTNRCNLSCIGCWNRSPLLSGEKRGRGADAAELDASVAAALIDDLARMGVKEINFSGGGEPLLYGPLFDLVRRAAGRGVSCTLNTNFTLVNEEIIGKIIGAGVSKVLASVWAGSGEVYERTHPGVGRGVFDRIERMLKLLARMRSAGKGPELVIVNVVSRRNAGDFEEMVKFAIDVGADAAWFTPVDAPVAEMRDLLLERERLKELRGIVPRCVEKYDSTPLPDGRAFRIQQADLFLEKISSSRAAEGCYHWDVIDTLPCYAGWVAVRILANGDVCPCCKADRFPLGNLYDSSFEEIWHSEAYAVFRRKAIAESKKTPYFAAIDCPRVCDNWWQMKEIHARVTEPSTPTGS